MTQKQTVLEHMWENTTITSKEAFDEYGITRLAARIADLRRDGWVITTTNKKGKNRFGHTVIYAEYRLGKADA